MPRITKVQRWLDLIAYLVGRRIPVPAEQILSEVPAYAVKWRSGDETARASVRRMFERDKDELRRAGIPIQTVRCNVNYGQEEYDGYRLSRRDIFLPYLELVRRSIVRPADPTARSEPGDRPRTPTRRIRFADPARIERVEIGPEDAAVALDALRRMAALPAFPFAREARTAFRKLAFDLGPETFREGPVLVVPRPGAGEVAERLRLVSEALLARKRLHFRYHGRYRGETTEREVLPYGLLFQRGHWYLFAHDPSRGAIRTFRLDRMGDVTPNRRSPGTPDYDVPADFRIADYVGREPWELGDDPPIEAEVRFAFPTSLWAERNGHGTLVEELPDGASIRRFRVRQVNPFLRWLLGLGEDVVLERPPELVQAYRTLVLETAALYETGEPDA